MLPSESLVFCRYTSRENPKVKGEFQVQLLNLSKTGIYRVSQKNDPTLQCHIIKNIEFDVLKFSTVIQHALK